MFSVTILLSEFLTKKTGRMSLSSSRSLASDMIVYKSPEMQGAVDKEQALRRDLLNRNSTLSLR